jgi:hypothetical protein
MRAMRDIESDNSTTPTAGRVVKRATITIGAILGSLLIVVIIGYAVVWPAILRSQIRRELAAYWTGPIDVGAVELGWDGPLIVHDIVLRNLDRSAAVVIPQLQAQLVGWPGLKPDIAELSISGLGATFNLSNPVPVRLPAPSPSERPSPLANLTLSDTTITIIQADGATFVIRDLAFDLNKQINERHDVWDYVVAGAAQDDAFTITGRIDRRSPDDETLPARLTTSLVIPRGMLTATIALATDPAEAPDSEVLDADIRWQPRDEGQRVILTSRSQIRQPEPTQYTVHTDASLIVPGELNQALVSDLTVDLDRAADMLVDLYIGTAGPYVNEHGPSGDLLDGQAAADLELTVTRDLRPAWRSRGWASDVSVRRMEPYLDVESQYANGVLNSLMWDIRGHEPEWATLTGGVYGRMSDLTIAPNTLLFNLLRAITPEFATQEATDVIVSAGLTGSTLTFETAQVGNEILSITADPGGTADLHTHELDMMVSVLMLRDLNGFLDQVPILGPIADIGEHLTRTHVTGPWDDPTLEVVPVEDMGENILDLLDDLLRKPGGMMLPMPGE